MTAVNNDFLGDVLVKLQSARTRGDVRAQTQRLEDVLGVLPSMRDVDKDFERRAMNNAVGKITISAVELHLLVRCAEELRFIDGPLSEDKEFAIEAARALLIDNGKVVLGRTS